ncbi:hypothetical protein F5Y00DRAFT_272202 [Daldinia vernicosa]|uniref:uncharacterized protein n=1 Tax=Daldinia vernicosa TaxID=114800 RepID=UPI0020072E49|nr:uncharacterized protein F5Y00DRAFT_272202 [Daldinia vernicosa]KAI0846258.1 hypothetical protein F5Y00DRAFT_272202 [Daldinia vernicosa]
MDFLDELEDSDDIKRWQSLFGYTHVQAIQKIQEHRADLSRVPITDSHWDIVRAEKEAEGYNKEAYEHSHSLMTSLTSNSRPRKITSKTKPSVYLLKLEGPLDTVIRVQSAAGLDIAPQEHRGTDDSGEHTVFCKVDVHTKEKLGEFLASQGSRFQPTFIRYSRAEKDLSTKSAYPTLGIDTTMPQHRLCSNDDPKLVPAQNQYPVWYFFYGTLADPSVLKRLLGIDPSYCPASVVGGVLKTWGGKYKALVDAPSGKTVRGQAFLVKNQEQEECLQLYETDKYDVVRCEFQLHGKKVKGLTFRFIGDVDP